MKVGLKTNSAVRVLFWQFCYCKASTLILCTKRNLASELLGSYSLVL